MEKHTKKRRVAMLSVISNTLLVVFKFIVGIFIGSVSVISEAIHSSVDLLAALIAYFAVRTAGKPPDKGHSYGHGKFENISGTIEAILIFFAAAWIIWEAVEKLIHPSPVETVGYGVLVMTISAIVNIFVSEKLFKVARETDSVALEADGWHLRTDVYTSAGVAVGLAIYWVAKVVFPDTNLHWIDPVIAMFVALLILRAAWKLTKQSTGALVDVSLPKEEEQQIIKVIESKRPKIISYHKLKTRKSGAERFVEFHLLVDKNMSVKDSHDICDEITREIKSAIPETTVMIHIEPCEEDCTDICIENCHIHKPGLVK